MCVLCCLANRNLPNRTFVNDAKSLAFKLQVRTGYGSDKSMTPITKEASDGCGRKVHWESRQPGRQSIQVADVENGTMTGNSANAQQVAANKAKKIGLEI